MANSISGYQYFHRSNNFNNDQLQKALESRYLPEIKSILEKNTDISPELLGYALDVVVQELNQDCLNLIQNNPNFENIEIWRFVSCLESLNNIMEDSYDNYTSEPLISELRPFFEAILNHIKRYFKQGDDTLTYITDLLNILIVEENQSWFNNDSTKVFIFVLEQLKGLA